MSSLSAAPRGTRSSCLRRSDKLSSCCPHSASCSWTSAPSLQEYFTSDRSPSLFGVCEAYMYVHGCTRVNSPASISQRAKRPMRTSPFTVHFCVSQLGLQLWFINREEFPFGPASITRSWGGKRALQSNKADGRRLLSSKQESRCQCGYLGEGEHVEVGHVIFVGAFDSLLTLLGVYYLSNVLGHEVTLGETANVHFNSVLCIACTPLFWISWCGSGQHLGQRPPSWGPGWSWGPNRGRRSSPRLSLHTVAWRSTGSHSCRLQDIPDGKNKTGWESDAVTHHITSLVKEKKKNEQTQHSVRPVGDTHTAACGLGIGSEGRKDARPSVCSCIAGSLTSQLRAPALCPPACWTERRTRTEYEKHCELLGQNSSFQLTWD